MKTQTRGLQERKRELGEFPLLFRSLFFFSSHQEAGCKTLLTSFCLP